MARSLLDATQIVQRTFDEETGAVKSLLVPTEIELEVNREMLTQLVVDGEEIDTSKISRICFFSTDGAATIEVKAVLGDGDIEVTFDPAIAMQTITEICTPAIKCTVTSSEIPGDELTITGLPDGPIATLDDDVHSFTSIGDEDVSGSIGVEILEDADAGKLLVTLPATAGAAQADYIVFPDASKTHKIFMWLDIDEDGTLFSNTGDWYEAESSTVFYIKVPISTGNTAAQNMQAAKTALRADVRFEANGWAVEQSNGVYIVMQS